MALCRYCKKDMRTADSCVDLPFIGGYHPVPYGQEQGWPITPPARCPDCNVKLGHFHHPHCDKEECPRCHNQALSCSCFDERQQSRPRWYPDLSKLRTELSKWHKEGRAMWYVSLVLVVVFVSWSLLLIVRGCAPTS